MTPAQSPGCARSGCAESALFQGLILNLCFSHPPQALSRLGLVFYFFFFCLCFLPIVCFALQADKVFYLRQHLPVRSSCRRDSVCLSSSPHSFLFHFHSNISPLAEPSFSHLSMLFSGKQIPADAVVLQSAPRGCRHRERLHRVA